MQKFTHQLLKELPELRRNTTTLLYLQHTYLEELDCSNNQLQTLTIPQTIQRLYCQLNHQLVLQNIPGNLKVLNISFTNNSIKRFQQSFLETLIVSLNDYIIIPDSLIQLTLYTSCDFIQFSDNNKLSFSIINGQNLKELSIHFKKNFSQIQNCPKSLRKLKIFIQEECEEELDLSNTQLQSFYGQKLYKIRLPSTLQDLQLQYYGNELNISNTQINHLILDNSEIKTLILPQTIKYLSFNKIEIDQIIMNNKNILTKEIIQGESVLQCDFRDTILQQLFCSMNNINKLLLPQTLFELCCFDNKLEELKLPNNLQQLNCENNKLKQIIFPLSLNEGNVLRNDIEQLYTQRVNYLKTSSLKLNICNNLRNLYIQDKCQPVLILKETKLQSICCNNCKIELIQLPPSIQSFSFPQCEVQVLDMFYTQQQNITIQYNIIHTLIAPNCLQYLNICDCETQTLYIDNTQLKQLNCSNNNIKYLHLPKKLKILDCNNNKLINLNFPNSLEILRCDDNQLQYLDISQTSIYELYCKNNPLINIKFNQCLQKIECSPLQQNHIDLSKTQIKSFIYKKRLEFLSLPKTVGTFLIQANLIKYDNKYYNGKGLKQQQYYQNDIKLQMNTKNVRMQNKSKLFNTTYLYTQIKTLKYMRKLLE